MAFVVQRAVALPDDDTGCSIPDDVRNCALPNGFPLLLDDESEEIIEPVFLYLLKIHRPASRKRWKKNTVDAHISDLKDFWQFLEAREITWTEVEEEDLHIYRESMMSVISHKTHAPLADATVRRRMVTVVSFFDWARSCGLYRAAEFSKRSVCRVEPIDHDAMAHLRGNSQLPDTAAVVPEATTTFGDQVRPIERRQLAQLLHCLGPLPSNQIEANKPIDSRPSRDRLAAEIARTAGLRVDEVAGLTVHQILDRCPSDWMLHNLGPFVSIRITRTKGDHPRTILLPTWLLRELDLYIRGERAAAVDRRQSLQSRTRKSTTAHALFLNGPLSRNNVGKPVQTYTLQAAFRRSVLEAGLTERITRVDPNTGKMYNTTEAAHSFHDLRHTFAMEIYYAEIRRGNTAPWKIVQSKLGHKHLSTTLKFYMNIVDSYEAAISDDMYAFTRSLATVGADQ